MLKSYNLKIKGRRTTVRLEPEFHTVLGQIAQRQGKHIDDIVSQVKPKRGSSFTSLLRVYILENSRDLGNIRQ